MAEGVDLDADHEEIEGEDGYIVLEMLYELSNLYLEGVPAARVGCRWLVTTI